FLPGTTANSDFNPGDRCRPGPGDTTNGQLSVVDLALGLRLGDQSPHSLQRYRLSHDLSFALPLEEVCSGLVMTIERLADHLNLRKPFDRRHGIPPWNDKPQRIPMLDRKYLSVHRVGKQRLGSLGIIYAQAALEANWFAVRIKIAAVSSSKHYLS